MSYAFANIETDVIDKRVECLASQNKQETSKLPAFPDSVQWPRSVDAWSIGKAIKTFLKSQYLADLLTIFLALSKNVGEVETVLPGSFSANSLCAKSLGYCDRGTPTSLGNLEKSLKVGRKRERASVFLGTRRSTAEQCTSAQKTATRVLRTHNSLSRLSYQLPIRGHNAARNYFAEAKL